MGNNITALTQFYSPPSPPTPLSTDKYFWIKRSYDHKVDGGNGNNSSSLSTELGAALLNRDIPVVYITPASNSNGDSTKKCGAEEGGEEEGEVSSRCTLLYCHGHDVDLGLIYNLLVHMSNLLGVDIMSFDYSGYGLSKIGRLDNEQYKQDGKDENNSLGDLTEQSSASNATTSQQQLELPSEEQCNADILTCFNYLVEEKGVLPQNIVLYGKSLGSGPVCWLAQKLCQEADVKQEEVNAAKLTADLDDAGMQKQSKPIKFRRTPTPVAGALRRSSKAAVPLLPPPLGGLILHSAFLSILRLKVGFTISSVGDPFDNVARLDEMHSSSSKMDGPGYNLPIYLIHGKDDAVVPFNHGQVLCGLIMEKRRKGFPPFWADGGTHGNVEHKYATAYIKRLQQFLRHCDKVNNGGVCNKDKSRVRSRSIPRANIRLNKGLKNATGNLLSAQQGDFTSTEITVTQYSPNGDSANNYSSIQEQIQMSINEASGRCHGSSRRPSNTVMTHHRARSSSRARQRKKKGTLVMRGAHEEEEEMTAIAERKSAAMVMGQNSNGNQSKTSRMVSESRNPPSSMARMI